MKVDFYRHELRPEDAEAIAEVLGSPFLTTGPVARAVEAQLASYFSLPYAALVNSWTNGALALLLAIDLGPEDEVIVPAMTFIATANVVALAGAKVVFADVDPETLLLSPEEVARRLTPRTRAIIPVHLYGQMADVEGIRRVVDEVRPSNRIWIIEDAAHCFEGERNSKKPGHWGDAAIFSFYATKNVTCGEGGAVVTNVSELYERLLQSRLHGMSAIAADRFSGGRYNAWDMLRLGTKANLPDLLAALLPRQISTIDVRLPERQEYAARYRKAFAGGPLRLVAQIAQCNCAEHIFPIGVPGGRRDAAIVRLNEAGIGVTVNYRSVPSTSFYSERQPGAAESCPVSNAWGDDTVTLPLFPGLTRTEQEYVIDVVRTQIYPLVRSSEN